MVDMTEEEVAARDRRQRRQATPPTTGFTAASLVSPPGSQAAFGAGGAAIHDAPAGFDRSSTGAVLVLTRFNREFTYIPLTVPTRSLNGSSLAGMRRRPLLHLAVLTALLRFGMLRLVESSQRCLAILKVSGLSTLML